MDADHRFTFMIADSNLPADVGTIVSRPRVVLLSLVLTLNGFNVKFLLLTWYKRLFSELRVLILTEVKRFV